MAVEAPTVGQWSGENVTVADVERALAQLRDTAEGDAARLRTSTMTHLAWVPLEWLEAATRTLAGLAERHPARTILLIPDPEAEDGLDAEVVLNTFAVGQERFAVASEVIRFRLRGRRAEAPASIVMPLLITDLPVFLRWRGQPPFGSRVLEQLIGVVDRFVVDSSEWLGLPDAYDSLVEIFDHAAVSDIAWRRAVEWRLALAALWPGIAALREVRVTGPLADALLLAGWLRSRLERDVELVDESAQELERVVADGLEVPAPGAGPPSASDLLSAELDEFGRDPVYEDAVRAAR